MERAWLPHMGMPGGRNDRVVMSSPSCSLSDQLAISHEVPSRLKGASIFWFPYQPQFPRALAAVLNDLESMI